MDGAEVSTVYQPSWMRTGAWGSIRTGCCIVVVASLLQCAGAEGVGAHSDKVQRSTDPNGALRSEEYGQWIAAHGITVETVDALDERTCSTVSSAGYLLVHYAMVRAPADACLRLLGKTNLGTLARSRIANPAVLAAFLGRKDVLSSLNMTERYRLRYIAECDETSGISVNEAVFGRAANIGNFEQWAAGGLHPGESGGHRQSCRAAMARVMQVSRSELPEDGGAGINGNGTRSDGEHKWESEWPRYVVLSDGPSAWSVSKLKLAMWDDGMVFVGGPGAPSVRYIVVECGTRVALERWLRLIVDLSDRAEKTPSRLHAGFTRIGFRRDGGSRSPIEQYEVAIVGGHPHRATLGIDAVDAARSHAAASAIDRVVEAIWNAADVKPRDNTRLSDVMMSKNRGVMADWCHAVAVTSR